jgi:hypothetical protein
LIVVGLLLSPNYSAQKSIKINANPHIIKSLVTDFSQWHKWSPWKKIDPSITFYLGKPSAGIGAHQSWQSKWGTGEMTITALSEKSMEFTILLAQEHIITGNILFIQNAKNVTVSLQINGQATTPLISGYVAILSERLLNNTLALGLNNLKTVAQLSDAQAVMASHSQQHHGQN